MLYVILNLAAGAALVAGLVAWIHSTGPKYHPISAAEIHPDLAVNEELLEDALSEYERDRR